jgi:hypothetical protein
VRRIVGTLLAVLFTASLIGFSGSDAMGSGASSLEPQSIGFDQLPPRTYGEAPFALIATASSGLHVEFASLSPVV